MILIIDPDVKEKIWKINVKAPGIYAVSNIANGRKYIGLTNNLRKAFENFNGKNKKHKKMQIYDEIKRYGQNMFRFEILRVCDENDDLKSIENEFIEKYHTNDPKYGYNISINGKLKKIEQIRIENAYKKISKKESLSVLKPDIFIAVREDKKEVIVTDDNTYMALYLNKQFGTEYEKDDIRLAIRKPEMLCGYRLFYDDCDKRRFMTRKLDRIQSANLDTEYIKISEFFNAIEDKDIYEIYQIITDTLGEIKTLVSTPDYVIKKINFKFPEATQVVTKTTGIFDKIQKCSVIC